MHVHVLEPATYSWELKFGVQLKNDCHYLQILGNRHFRDKLIFAIFFKKAEISEIKFHTNISTFTVL